MNLINVTDTRIFSAEFGDFHYKKFLDWAFVERQSKASLLRNLAVARTDANLGPTAEGLQHYCEIYQLELAELREYLYKADQNGVSIAALHDRLEKGLRGEDAWGKKTAPRNKKPPKK